MRAACTLHAELKGCRLFLGAKLADTNVPIATG